MKEARKGRKAAEKKVESASRWYRERISALKARGSETEPTTMAAQVQSLEARLATMREVDDKHISSVESQLQAAEKKLAQIPTLKRTVVGSGRRGGRLTYPEPFMICALSAIASGASPNNIRTLLRLFQRTFLPHLGWEDFEIPEIVLWRKLKLKPRTARATLPRNRPVVTTYAPHQQPL